MDLDNLISHIPLIGLYAELHYRFPFIKSRYYIEEPEIITDIPFRIEPGQDLPILLLIKESNKFPIIINNISISFYKQSNKSNKTTIIKKINKTIDSYLWYENIKLQLDIKGNYNFEILISYSINNKYKECLNNNVPILKDKAHKVYFSNYKLPKKSGYLYGDLHYHSILTDDMVEFGAPLDTTAIVAESIGLDFVCNTDHSYDLDIKEESWFEKDSDLIKWNKSRSDIDTINDLYKSKIVPSEEVTIHNSKKRNIHALALNNRSFLEGQGDGARKYFDRSCKYDTTTIHQHKEEQSAIIAAHPFVKTSFLEWLFIKRGKWEWNDIINKDLSGLQILNGSYNYGFYKGLEIWIKLLLNGYKKFIYAGNDAHGNFNKYRQIKIPMITLKEKNEQILGEFRTGVFTKKKIYDIVQSLRKGYCFITNGPFIEIKITDNNNNEYISGEHTQSKINTIELNIDSTKEFGQISIAKIFIGSLITKSENILEKFNNLDCYSITKKIRIKDIEKSYIRAECNIDSKKTIKAFTNPIWIR